MERLQYDRHVYIGLFQEVGGKLQADVSIKCAIHLFHTGGHGLEERSVDLYWQEKRAPASPVMVFPDGIKYEAHLEHSSVEGRVRLRVVAGGDREINAVWPSRTLALKPEEARSAEPLPAGEYLFGVLTIPKVPNSSGEHEVVLQIDEMELHGASF